MPEAAADELKDFIETQLSCAEITVVSASLGNLVVDHEWEDLSNGRISVTGTATVTVASGEEEFSFEVSKLGTID